MLPTSLDRFGLIFDLDGTLIESALAITAVANEFLRTQGLSELTQEETISFIGGGSQEFVRLMLQSRNAYVETDFARNFSHFSEIYLDASPELNQPFPGVETALRAMAAKGYRLAMCTNKPEAPTKRIVDALGWTDLFGALIAGDTLPVKKPDPTPLLEAAKRIDCTSYLYFGDSEVDEQCAARANQPFVLFTQGYRKTAPEDMRHAASFSDYTELASIVESLHHQ